MKIKKHPLYQTFIESPFSYFNHGCDILDTNYHSVFFNSFKMMRNSRSVRKFIFSGDDFRIIFSKSMKSQFASLPSGSMTVFCLMRSLNCQIIPFGYYSSSGLYASQWKDQLRFTNLISLYWIYLLPLEICCQSISMLFVISQVLFIGVHVASDIILCQFEHACLFVVS